MKSWIGWTSVLACFLLGCGPSEPVTKLSPADNQPAESESSAQTETAVEQVAKDLDSLTELAQQYEQERNFRNAASIWGQVEQLLVDHQ